MPVSTAPRFVIAGMPGRREARSWWDDISFALMKPLGAKGALVIGFGALLSVVSQMPLLVASLIALVTFFWLYTNYFILTIQSASAGRDELPDSPVGIEGLGVLRLLWMMILVYVALLLPAMLAGALSALLPIPVKPLIVMAVAWPLIAYPMTLLLAAQTLNGTMAFNYPAIVRSIADTAPSYARVLAFFVLVGALPHATRLLLKGEPSEGAAYVFAAIEAAWTMYSMMAVALLLGRFYRREEARLGWFTA